MASHQKIIFLFFKRVFASKKKFSPKTLKSSEQVLTQNLCVLLQSKVNGSLLHLRENTFDRKRISANPNPNSYVNPKARYLKHVFGPTK